MSPSEPLLDLRMVEKSYGGVHALRGVDFRVSRLGTVHALIGANGSGKSTLLSVLSGQVAADAGVIRMEGQEIQITSPLTALGHGIVMVSQETAIARDLSVAENILMGRLPRARMGVDWGAANHQAGIILDELGMRCAPTALVGSLRADERQMVEIARALAMRPRVLILDEPTSSLTDHEVQAVLDAIRRLKQREVATILVAHRLQELFAVADEVTVLRDGQRVASGPCADFSPDSLVTAMLGDTASAALKRRSNATRAMSVAAGTTPALELRGISGRGIRDVTLDVAAGQVTGLAGLVGSGRSDVLRAVFGVGLLSAGEMRIGGQEHRPFSPGDAIAAGVAYVPPERKTDGLVLSMTVRENLDMVVTARSHSGWRGLQAGSPARYDELLDRLRVRRSALGAMAGTLSGGNQQKIVLAKWLVNPPSILMLDEPTRGVDVGSRAEIHEILRELAGGGVTVLVSSSENPELLELCDEIVVMFGGRTALTFAREAVDEARLTAACNGHFDTELGDHHQRSTD